MDIHRRPAEGRVLDEVPTREQVLPAMLGSSIRVESTRFREGELELAGRVAAVGAETIKGIRPLYFLAVEAPDWVAVNDEAAGWPGVVVIAKSTGAPILHFPTTEAEVSALRKRCLHDPAAVNGTGLIGRGRP